MPLRVRARKLRPVKRVVRTPQQARSRETRERIVAAAIAAFEEHGYDDTNTAAIARRAGIGVGTLYGYFADKRKLMLEILDGTVREMADMVVEALDPARWAAGDPREHVRFAIEAVVGSRRISPGLQRILWERHLRDPEFRDANMAIESRMIAALEELFAALRARGGVRGARVGGVDRDAARARRGGRGARGRGGGGDGNDRALPAGGLTARRQRGSGSDSSFGDRRPR